MIDLRSVGYLIGLLVAALGVTMLVPFLVDVAAGNGAWPVFLQSAVLTCLVGGFVALACADAADERLSRQETFLLTTAVWGALPFFGAIPFVLGATEASVTDAVFEAMSGLTTTGATVFSGLDTLPAGLLVWRSMMQWFGGIGIIVVAMVFLPELRIGGMQIFRSEAFETMGKILPRAAEIASQISWIYVGLTVFCFLGYLTLGMTSFEAVNHALTTISTGGFSTTDASFGAFVGPAEYFAAGVMILASLPFVRFIQILAGTARPILTDPQVRGFIGMIFLIAATIAAHRVATEGTAAEPAFRQALFNVTSIASGTGYASADYQLWGAPTMVLIFVVGLVGGCAGSTCCSVKIFRYQILLSAIRAQVSRIHSPHGIFEPRYDGAPVPEDVMNSVMAFFGLFIASLSFVSIGLGSTGLDLVTSISGAATAIANIGPGLGEIIGPAGNFAPLNDTAKWLLIGAMLLGRLELMVVLAIFSRGFWRG